MLNTNLHSIPLEQSVLAALMTVAQSFESLVSKPMLDDFFSTRHQVIYAAIDDLASKGMEYDSQLVFEHLKSAQRHEMAGGEEYLMQLMADAPSSFYNLNPYVEKLKKLNECRKVEKAGHEIIKLAQNSADEDLLIKSQGLLSGIESTDATNTRYSVTDASVKALTLINQRFERQKNNTGLAYGVNTGLRDVDELIGDIEPTHLCVIAARPAMGKTTLAQMIAINAAKRNKAPVLFFSCEMTADQVTTRIVSALGRIPFNRIRKGTMTEEDYTSWVATTAHVLNNLTITINEKASATILDIREDARKMQAEHGKVGVIIIDYLQLLRDPKQKNRFDEISEISRQLKKLAKDFHCPVIALAQLSRDCEKRPNKRPILSDLRESGQIEQDADQVVFLYRDEVYNKESRDLGIAEIIVGKNRHGETGTARVATRLDYCHFSNLRVDDDVGGGV